MSSESLIHIKFEYGEALNSKRDLLSTEVALLRIAKAIKKYHSSRTEELKQKSKLITRLKEIKTNLNKLKTVLPKVKIPDILKKDEETGEPKIELEKEEPEIDLENQLQDIQDKLRSLSQ